MPQWQQMPSPVVHLHVFNSRGRTLPAKTSALERHPTGKMGHGRRRPRGLGRKRGDGLAPRSEEELGLTGFTPERLPAMCLNPTANVKWFFPHRCTYDGNIRPSAETDGGRFWSTTEIHEAMGKGIFTPNFESEYKRLFGNEPDTLFVNGIYNPLHSLTSSGETKDQLLRILYKRERTAMS